MVELRPEERDRGITTAKPRGTGQGEVTEEGECLGLTQQLRQLRALLILKTNDPQGKQTDH